MALNWITAYILNLCIILPVSQLTTPLFLDVLLCASCSLSLSSFQNLVPHLYVVPVWIQVSWVMLIDRKYFWHSCLLLTVKKANEIRENGQDMPRSIHTSNKHSTECLQHPRGPLSPVSFFLLDIHEENRFWKYLGAWIHTLDKRFYKPLSKADGQLTQKEALLNITLH